MYKNLCWELYLFIAYFLDSFISRRVLLLFSAVFFHMFLIGKNRFPFLPPQIHCLRQTRGFAFILLARVFVTLYWLYILLKLYCIVNLSIFFRMFGFVFFIT